MGSKDCRTIKKKGVQIDKQGFYLRFKMINCYWYFIVVHIIVNKAIKYIYIYISIIEKKDI